MDIQISIDRPVVSSAIKITGSKSETNRLLLLQALFPGIEITNGSESDDSVAMRQALAGSTNVIDIHHAGTAMRFLTAYFAQKEGRGILLTGSQRMQERPIGVLVDALRSLGADIQYAGNEGYPPLKITGKKLTGGTASIKAGVSSQYITALLLIAGRLDKGLELTLEGGLTSVPYIKMTLALLGEIGIETSFEGNVIRVNPTHNTQHPTPITVESDWSSASYFYSIVALSPVGTAITLSSYKQSSLQGDSALKDIYKDFGVQTTFSDTEITLTKLNQQPTTINQQLNDTPDIAQTIAVTCFGLGIGCHLTGLHTLKIKETDRLEALKTELEKFGADITVTNDSLTLAPHGLFLSPALSKGEGASSTQPAFDPVGNYINEDGKGTEKGMSEAITPTLKGPGEEIENGRNEKIAVATYNDHRMAMAFAPLALKTAFTINDAEVVSKSFPTFWEDMEQLGFVVKEL